MYNYANSGQNWFLIAPSNEERPFSGSGELLRETAVLFNTTTLDRVKGLTVAHLRPIIVAHQTEIKQMAVADHNVRPRTTIHEELHNVLKQDAEAKGLAVSEMIAFLIEQHYVNLEMYTPNNAKWKEKIKNQTLA